MNTHTYTYRDSWKWRNTEPILTIYKIKMYTKECLYARTHYICIWLLGICYLEAQVNPVLVLWKRQYKEKKDRKKANERTNKTNLKITNKQQHTHTHSLTVDKSSFLNCCDTLVCVKILACLPARLLWLWLWLGFVFVRCVVVLYLFACGTKWEKK